jgi:ATP-dependent exoDNAse (exonuclease V) beta subunit
MTQAPLRPVDVVTASAGTGKTYRLVEAVQQAINTDTKASAVLATTFTVRAAGELLGRARARLTDKGKRREAEQLLAGRFGTVNSVFGALLREFAFDGGRSPVTDVLGDQRARAAFRMAADPMIGRFADRLQSVAARLGYAEEGDRQRGGRRAGPSWTDLVSRIVDLARANGLSPERLAESRDRSWAGLQTLLEAARKGETADLLDNNLSTAITDAIVAIGDGDGTGTTDKAMEELRQVAAEVATGRPLPWQAWAKLAKIKGAKASNGKLDPVRAAAAAHARHPRLHADVEAMIRGVFDCAAESLGAYRDFKLARGLVDFSDQESEALRLLDRPNVAEVLAQRMDIALVDEFQDTSPIQLALFLRIARLARRSLWVGDPKQSIYGFRGSDPELMSAVAAAIAAASGGCEEKLSRSYRSRPALVALANEIFVPAFAPQGIGRASVRCEEADRTDAPGQPPPLAVWHLSGGKKEERAAALAVGVGSMIQHADEWPVVPKGATRPRPVAAGDIAILCRTGDTCAAVANALEAQGVPVAIGRDGLLQSAECALAFACLRWLADASDTLALAEIAHLVSSPVDGAQPSWFAQALDRKDGLATLRGERIPAALQKLRPQLLSMTPSEALDAAIGAAELPGLIAGWGASSTRLGNLDALRRLALEYEEDCRQSRKPATASGLAAWLEESDAEKPAASDGQAVVVSTYHGAKGLEWPVTILFELDYTGGPRLFDQIVAESDRGTMDLDDPLADRWLRLWPWPYGQQRTNVGLDTRADQSATGVAATRRAAHEDVRLLYVAMTRARDYLVLAVDRPRDTLKTAALDALGSDGDPPLVVVPAAEGAPLQVAGTRHPCRVWMLAGGAGGAGTEAAANFDAVLPRPAVPAVHLPYRFAPSGAKGNAEAAEIVERIELGPRLALTGTPDMAALGDAVHGFLAADSIVRDAARRLDAAEKSMARWGVGGALSAVDLRAASDRLWQFLSARWPKANVLREWPVSGRVGLQRVSGRIDMLFETPEGWIIVDHKTYPGRPDTWEQRVAGYAPQLDLYGRLCAEATGTPIAGLFVHLPVAGVLLRVRTGKPA